MCDFSQVTCIITCPFFFGRGLRVRITHCTRERLSRFPFAPRINDMPHFSQGLPCEYKLTGIHNPETLNSMEAHKVSAESDVMMNRAIGNCHSPI